jgi:adenylate kinase
MNCCRRTQRLPTTPRIVSAIQKQLHQRMVTTHTYSSSSLLSKTLTKNITIVGPPGSGKGFYGRLLADVYDVPLWTCSTILKEANCNIASGQLLDDHKVSTTLHDYIRVHLKQHYFLDGYPRTPKQIELMETMWPIQEQAHVCLWLDVPDQVCDQKILGRRHCVLCNKDFNVANVQFGGFDLPPQLPINCKHGNDCEVKHFSKRADDTPGIAKQRVLEYRRMEGPIIEYYEREGRLLKYTPFKGEKELPRLKWTLEEWLMAFNR